MNFWIIFISVSFGTSAYHNIKSIPHRTAPLIGRELDKQLTATVLVQVIFNILADSYYR